MECQTSDLEQESNDTSSDNQRSAAGMGSATKPKKGMQISVGDEGGTQQSPPQMAQTTRASTRTNFSFAAMADELSDEAQEEKKQKKATLTQEERSRIKKELTQTLSAAEVRKQRDLARKKKIDEDYIKQRDPIKEFFQLTCQSIKINSPHMNLIAQIKDEILYKQAVEAGVPFFKFSTWIESTVNKEVMKQLLYKSKNKPERRLSDAKKNAALRKQAILEE